MMAADAYLIVRNTKGSAYGNMYFAPTKPVLQSRTNTTGALFSKAFTSKAYPNMI
jgi:hypothetical protein